MSEPVPTAETLIQHAGWLKGLATRLVKDECRADDVVQQALLQAVRKPPRDPKALPAWLARVARNEARQMGRSEQARTRREQRVGQVRSSLPTVDVVERAELHRRVVDAVLSIEEPFRSVVLLRYFDGMEPKDIARHLGWPPGTVRSRLKRGLDQLREAMDDRSGGDRRAWTLSLVTFVNPKDVIGGGAALAPAAVVGAWLVSNKVMVWTVAALLVVALGVFVATRMGGADAGRGDEERTTGSLREETEEPGDPRLAGDPRTAEADEPAPPEVAEPLVPAAPRARLRFTDGQGQALAAADVERRYREAGLPLEAVVVSESLLVVTEVAEAAARRFSGSREGRRVIPWSVTAEGLDLELEPGTWRVLLSRPAASPLLSDVIRVDAAGDVASVEFPLPDVVPGVRLRLVAAEDQTPLEGAQVVPYYEFGDDLAFFEGAALTTDAHGEVTIPVQEVRYERPRSRTPSWWAVAPGRLAPVHLPRAPGDEVHVRPVPLCAEVAGTAWRQDGEAAAGLEVVWTKKGRRVSTVVKNDGSFALQGVPANRGTQDIWLLEDMASMRLGRAQAPVRPGERSEIVIGEPASDSPRAVIVGRVTAGGHPVANAMAMARPEGAGREEGVIAKTDADGRYRLVVPAGSLELLVYFGGADDFYVRSTAPMDLAVGVEKTLDFDLPGGALKIKLVDANTGDPIPGAGAYAAPVNREVEAARFPGFVYRAGSAGMGGADGTVVLRALVPGEPHGIETFAEGYASRKKADVLPSGAGEPPVELILRLERRP